jgi:ankyrin repeat protein
MGNSHSNSLKKRHTYGEIEYNMENDRYIYLSSLISNDNFDYLEKIPIEFHNKDATCTYLHLAAKYDSIVFIRLWLKQGYPINCLDYRGWTALHWAVYYNSINAFIILIRCGISLYPKIPFVFKKKNRKFINKNAIEMCLIMNRKYMIIFYEKHNRHKSHYISNVYQDHTLYITNAKSLSTSYVITELPKTKYGWSLIETVCGWNIFSDNYGNILWKNITDGHIQSICPYDISCIPSLSYC